MPFYYREIDAPSVDPLIRARARVVLDHCKKVLGLGAVEIQWVRPISKAEYEFIQAALKVEELLAGLGHKHADPNSVFFQDEKEFLGQTYGGGPRSKKILVREDVPLREILKTIAHECRHFRDYQIYRPPWTPEEEIVWERTAENFAEEAISFLEKSERMSL